MMRISDLLATERPRERMRKSSPESLGATELLAILLGTGNDEHDALELAARLLLDPGIERLSTASLAELLGVRGIGPAKACRIVAAFELARRAAHAGSPGRVANADDAIAYCRPIIGHLCQEHFLSVFLSASHKVLGHELITKGLVNESLVHCREVFKGAIRVGASAIILAHNHPSGSLEASDEDLEATRILKAAGEIIGIQILDHVIVTSAGGKSVHG